MVDLLRRVAGDPPAEALLAPFRIGTEAALREMLAAAFEEVTVLQWSGVARFPSSKAWLETEIEAWTLRDLISDDQYRDLQAEAPTVLSQFCGPDGQVSFPVTAIVADALSPR